VVVDDGRRRAAKVDHFLFFSPPSPTTEPGSESTMTRSGSIWNCMRPRLVLQVLIARVLILPPKFHIGFTVAS